MARYRVTVERPRCIACRVAPRICLQVFELGNDNGRNRVDDSYSVETANEISIIEVPGLYACVSRAVQHALYRQSRWRD